MRRAVMAPLAVCAVLGVAGCASPGPTPLPQLAGAADTPFILADVEGPEQRCQLTGPGAVNDTVPVMIAGTDLGSMFRSGDRTWFAFGDTFGERAEGMTGGGGTIWRSNALAYSTDTDPTDCITFDGWITDEVGWAKEILPSKKQDNDEITVIPTYGFEANGAMYIHYMSVRHWGPPGEWETNHAGLARSTDGRDVGEARVRHLAGRRQFPGGERREGRHGSLLLGGSRRAPRRGAGDDRAGGIGRGPVRLSLLHRHGCRWHARVVTRSRRGRRGHRPPDR